MLPQAQGAAPRTAPSGGSGCVLSVPCVWGMLASPPRSSPWHPMSQSHGGTPAQRTPTPPSSARSRGRGKRRRRQRGEYLTFIFSSRVVFQNWRQAVRRAAPPPAPSTSPGLSALFPRRGLGQETLGLSQGTGAERGPSCWQRGTAGQGHREMEAGLCCAMRCCARCCAPGRAQSAAFQAALPPQQHVGCFSFWEAAFPWGCSCPMLGWEEGEGSLRRGQRHSPCQMSRRAILRFYLAAL